ncbi:uncharacterized protein I303_105594 [Kwoniella dejecticola CBS 10117]|uniref:Uncharacterized protein n=1 Tax=Kwoniella dejecticola CBS 10117 TaxID=1296121 RepID=A0A1A6A217_9TREE|nr:uncharacterized protein I303_04963 [Kwoniella dejecticola CBS 10117]OBR84106.1 hypothetical protein I303_04963 [Kwoniella dejecticola CBS 10117]
MPIISSRTAIITVCLPIVILKSVQWYIEDMAITLETTYLHCTHTVSKHLAKTWTDLVTLWTFLVGACKTIIGFLEGSLGLPTGTIANNDTSYDTETESKDSSNATSTNLETPIEENSHPIDLEHVNRKLYVHLSTLPPMIEQYVFVNETWKLVQLDPTEAEAEAEAANVTARIKEDEAKFERLQRKQSERRAELENPTFPQDPMLHFADYTCVFNPMCERESNKVIDALLEKNKEMIKKHEALLKQFRSESERWNYNTCKWMTAQKKQDTKKEQKILGKTKAKFEYLSFSALFDKEQKLRELDTIREEEEEHGYEDDRYRKRFPRRFN